MGSRGGLFAAGRLDPCKMPALPTLAALPDREAHPASKQLCVMRGAHWWVRNWTRRCPSQTLPRVKQLWNTKIQLASFADRRSGG